MLNPNLINLKRENKRNIEGNGGCLVSIYFLNNFWLEKEILIQLMLARLLMVHTIIYMH
jgi:hypothetical protein